MIDPRAHSYIHHTTTHDVFTPLRNNYVTHTLTNPPFHHQTAPNNHTNTLNRYHTELTISVKQKNQYGRSKKKKSIEFSIPHTHYKKILEKTKITRIDCRFRKRDGKKDGGLKK